MYIQLFPIERKEQLVATRNANIQEKTYNQTTITQLGICKIKIENDNKEKICNLFLVSGNGKALLGFTRH